MNGLDQLKSILNAEVGKVPPIVKDNGPDTLHITVQCFMCKGNFCMLVSKSGYNKWKNGEYIQNALTELCSAERELLISQTCDDCFHELFPK